MIVDEADIICTAGHGGRGKVSFGRAFRSGPDGGNGGKGGDIYFSVTSDLTGLNRFMSDSKVVAPDGEPGGSKNSYGKNGLDIEISLPLGTEITNIETGETIEFTDLEQRVRICKGGKGGRGNYEFKSGRNTRPEYAQPGLPGEVKSFKVILKYLAEFGLIGLPNAGKSSLLNELTNANAVIGAYPFTTLEANLGVYHGKVIADIPGLIEGASSGRGLGTKFLKHIEKVKMLLHCVAADSVDIVKDYKTIMTELKQFDPEVAAKPQVIILTKTDMVDAQVLSQQTKKLAKFKLPIHPVSIHDSESLERLKQILL